MSRSRRYRLFRSILIFAVIVFVGALAILSEFPGTNSRGTSTTTSPPTSPPTTPTTSPPPTFVPPGSTAGASTYQIANYTTSYSEPGRQICLATPAGQSCGPRVIQIGAFYPAITSGSTPVPYRGYDHLGLVIFAPGFDEFYSAYSPIIDAMVNAGFVVVAINFPRTNPEADGGLDELDEFNQPGDVSAAISWALSANAQSSSPLYQLIDPAEVAIAGQSDGGNTVLAVAYNSCCMDSRVKAAIIYSGTELPGFGGTFFPAGASTPMLVVQGSADTINPPGESTQIYTAAPSPKYLLWLLGATHLNPYTQLDQYESITAAVTADFLKGYLNGDTSALSAMAAAGSVAGIATFSSG